MGGPLVTINSGAGPPVSRVGCSPGAATAPKEAIDSQPGSTSEPPQAGVPPEPVVFSSAATVLKQAAEDGTPFCEECAKAAEARKKSGG